MRIGVFGGSFDPVHDGHLAPVRAVAAELSLDRVVYVPASRNPVKAEDPAAPSHHRVAMLALALAGRRDWTISLFELSRPAPSYTVDTLRELRRRSPADEIFLLMGSDAAEGFARWREPAEILRLARPAVFVREPFDQARLSREVSLAPFRPAFLIFDSVRVTISATDLRRRARAGEPLREWMPETVEEYIFKHRLYRDGSEAPGL